ncbi:protein kinase domain-containing protein [Melittangium boletus]|uniref:Protein kinase n=1 Tax=Melittangium boletus DSM 14713 TaxID=1294270 RepID=A0A250IBM2_9BACT|nr:protein kinase [Melittangium boletus]ATB28618.1 protein kinase [Melittangium boletus DSM 14713]
MPHTYTSGAIVGERYRVVRYISEGGMQEVFLATDMILNRQVALKVPFNQSARKRFNRSATLSAKVNHPNAARTLDYLADTVSQHLVEEFIGGQNLGEVMAAISCFDPDACAWVLHHLARGLAAVHRHGVVHRDLKPGNIMVTGGLGFDGLKITDFGVARMAEQEIEEAVKTGTVTTSKTAIGALPYMAPEVIDTPGKPMLPADIWAVGALVFQLLSGELPFGQGFAAVPRIQAAVAPAMPKAVQDHPQFSHLGREIHGILLQCLQRDPSARPTAIQLVSLCDRLCYSPIVGRKIGVVEGYPGRSFGFIRPQGDGGSVFFHVESVVGRKPRVGQRVWYQPYDGTPRERAHPVIPMVDE